MKEGFEHNIFLVSKKAWPFKELEALKCWVLQGQEVVLINGIDDQFRICFRDNQGKFEYKEVIENFQQLLKRKYKDQFTKAGTLLKDLDKDKELRQLIYRYVKDNGGHVFSLLDRTAIKVVSTHGRGTWGKFTPGITISKVTEQGKFNFMTRPPLRRDMASGAQYIICGDGIREITAADRCDENDSQFPGHSKYQSVSVISVGEG